MDRTIIAHALDDDPADKDLFRKALNLEADRSLGRNPLNMIEMTTDFTTLKDKRSVQEIVEVSLLGKFATLEILASLLEGGDIQEAGIKRTGGAAPTIRPVFKVLAEKPPYVGYGVGLGISLIFLILSLVPFDFDFLMGSPGSEISSMQGYLTEVSQERVEWGTRIFFLERGRYPENLKELVDAGIVTEKDVQAQDVRGKGSRP